METLKKIEQFFVYFDIYGHKVDFYINSQTVVKSKLGATISLFIYAVCLYLFINNWRSWLEYKDLQTITSTQSFSLEELLNANQSYIYYFDYHNYNLYYVLDAEYPDGTDLPYEDIQKYFVQSFVYVNASGVEMNLDFNNCLVRTRNAFLLQSNEDLESYNETCSNFDVCLQQNSELLMGLISSIPDGEIQQPSIIYRVSKCQNSSMNNYSCASEADMAAISKYVRIQSSIPKSLYDFNNPSNPRKRSFDYSYNHMDLSSKKVLTGTLIPVYLYTDHGYVYDDYVLDSVDFNVDTMQYETLNIDTGDAVLFEQTFFMGLNQQIYYRKNEKINTIISNFGGMVNVLLIIGKMICYSYNFLLLKHKLINISFSNLDKNDREVLK